jgi:imidazolonepropionase-like amidohydrolase
VKTYLLHSDEYEARRDADVPLGMKGLSPEVYTLVVREAQSRGLRVSTHIESAADFRTAVAAGVDEINHLPGYYWSEGKDAQTYRLTPQDAQAAAAAGVVVVTTTGVSPQFYKAGSPELAALQALQVENLRTLHDAGVTLSIGSDNYMGTARNEVDNLIAIGAFTPSELLDLWVGTAKASVFPDRALSCLKPGCEASFLAMQADPSQDLAALKALSLRVKSGVTLP